MGSCRICLFAGVVFAIGAVGAGAETIDESYAVPKFFSGAHVDSLVSDGLAERAGLRVHDVIIGIQGVRTRSSAEYQAVRFASWRADDIRLMTVREGRSHELIVKGTGPTKRFGFSMRDQPLSVDIARVWGMEERDFFPDAVADVPPTTGIDSVLGAFTTATTIHWDDERLSLSTFPLAAQETLANWAGDVEPVKAWVVGLLKGYSLLVREEYEQAAVCFMAAGVGERSVDPSLDSLGSLYVAIARRGRDGESLFGPGLYDASSSFIAAVYPYPEVVSSQTNGFSHTPEFARLFEMATSGDDGQASLAKQHVNSGSPSNATPAERYINQVKSALIAPVSYGGWPFRSSLIWNSGDARAVIRELHQRWEEMPQDRTSTAFAMVTAAWLVKDDNAFAKAYRHLGSVGSREIACANRFLAGAKRTRRAPGTPAMVTVMQAVQRKLQTAEVYRYLLANSPGYRRACEQTLFDRKGSRILTPASFCRANSASIVTLAIADPVTDAARAGEFTKSLNAYAQSGSAPQHARRLLNFLGHDPELDEWLALLALHDRLGGRVLDLASVALMRQTQLGVYCRDNGLASDEIIAFLDRCEFRSYIKVREALQSAATGKDELVAVCEAIHLQYGSPTVWMLLASHLRGAGLEDEARRYLTRTDDLAVIGRASYRRLGQRLEWQMCRDGMAHLNLVDFGTLHVPGLPDHWRPSLAFLRAQSALLDGEMATAVSELSRTYASPQRRALPGQLVYNGNFYRTVPDARRKMLGDLIAAEQLSGQQIQSLVAAGATDIEIVE